MLLQPVAAAVNCARRLGLAVERTAPLRSTNNTVVVLQPVGVVVKISTGHHNRLGLEVTAAGLLAAAGAPVVGPSRLVAAEVHREAGFDMTFWPYEPPSGSAGPGGSQVASALFRLHSALQELTLAWPTLDDQLKLVRRRLDHVHFASKLQPDDRRLLARAIDSGRDRLGRTDFRSQTLHGSPHRGNILMVEDRPRFIDFETVCTGPLEWDLAHLDEEATRAYPGAVDTDALSAAQLLVAATTAAWCWHDIEKGPDMSFHAEHHLRSVREAMS